MAEFTVKVTDGDFESKVVQSDQPVLVDFWAPWCGPCMAISQTLEQIAEEYKGKVTVAKINVDENANIPASYAVRSIPYLALFKGGEVVDSVVGSVPKAKLTEMIDKAL